MGLLFHPNQSAPLSCRARKVGLIGSVRDETEQERKKIMFLTSIHSSAGCSV